MGAKAQRFTTLVVATVAAASIGSAADAARYTPGGYLEVSGTTILAIEMTVTDYFYGIAPAAGVPEVGDSAQKRLELGYSGYVDDTREVYDYLDAGYNFSNGWDAYVNSRGDTVYTECGFAIDFCVGDLAGPDYVPEASYDYSYHLVVEGGDPAYGDPVNWFFSEQIAFNNKNNPDDYHVFTAEGRSIPVSTSQVPLPATLGLMFGTVACFFGLFATRRPRIT